MKAPTVAALALSLLFPAADHALAASHASRKAQSAVTGVTAGMRCRRLQQAAQSVLASQGAESPRVVGAHRGRQPRRVVKNILGYAAKRRTVGRGCYRCIVRQFRHGIPVARQLACGTHDLCVEGGALRRSIGTCIGAVCDGESQCCRRKWDTRCVSKARAACEVTCEPCSHDVCEPGAALSAGCSPCAANVCATDPYCCDTYWSDECVAKVETACEQSCESPPSTIPETSTTTPDGPTSTTVSSAPSTTVSSPGSTTPGGGGGSTTPSTSSTTVPQTETTVPVGVSTTLPTGGSTLPSPTTTLSTPGTTVVTETPGGEPSSECVDVLDFEDDPAGTIVCDQETKNGQPVVVKGTNPKFGGALNLGLIYDSSCSSGTCSGDDADLGTPNEAFGGPGVGAGGGPGQPGQNDKALGNVLIVAANYNDFNHDGLVDNPDDQGNKTVTMEFDFSAFAPTSVLGLTVIDIEPNEQPASAELFDMTGTSLGKFGLPSGGNNGVNVVDLPANTGVWKMIVTLRGSGAVDDIRLSCSGSGSSTTLPPPTTTVPTPTTTVPPPPTTTVPPPTTTLPPPPTTTVPPPTTTLPPPPTTTVPPPTTTLPPPPTTTVPPPPTTLPPPPTTTTLGGSTECPNTAELTIVAGTGGTCTTNADCAPVGSCNQSTGRCNSATDLDTGWTGIAHNADLNDKVLVKAALDCSGTGPACGECSIAGIDPSPGYCRCADNNQIKCDEPLANDTNDCGGAACNCYVGPPLPLSAGNNPACILNKLSADLSGTTNVDTGDSSTSLKLRSIVYLGIKLYIPCPVCAGTCSAGKPGTTVCILDSDCDTSAGAGDGTCANFDATPGDGVRGGKCFGGANDGQACDIDVLNQSFPAPGGGGHSLDCLPDTGKNISGAGLIINIDQTTGNQSLGRTVPCGIPPFAPFTCPCGQCTGDATRPCVSDTDCSSQGAGTCTATGGKAFPDQCNNVDQCVDTGDGVTGECDGTGPDDRGCDAVLKANGEFFISCNNNSDCDAGNIEINGGTCTLTRRRQCFLPTINAHGSADPETPIGAGIFCIPPTANVGINSTAGLPGPGRVVNQGFVEYLCTNGKYETGVGCP